jgi:O-antigen/teichoic acid export membrane protein
MGGASLYAALMAGASVLGLAKTVVLAKLLGTTELGYYGLVIIVLPLGTLISTFGILSPLGVELPMAFGAGAARAHALRDRALGLILAGAVAIGAIGLLVVLVVTPGDSGTTTALALSSFTVMLTAVFEFYLVVLRARVRLVALGSGYFARSALALAATSAGAAAFGYRGAIIAEIAVLVAVVAYVAWALEPSTRPRRPRRAEAMQLVRLGVPLSCSSLLLIIVVFADRAFVAASLPDELGQYTFASVVSVAWFAIVGFVAQAAGASALHAFGAGQALLVIRRRLAQITAALIGGGLLSLPLLLLATRALEANGFASYAPALEVMPILYAGGAVSAATIYGYLLLALRRFPLVLAATGLGGIVAIGGGLALVAGEPTITDFAWLFLASQLVSALFTLTASEVVVRRLNPAP